MNFHEQNNYRPTLSDPSNIKITNVVISLPTLANKLKFNEIALHPNNSEEYFSFEKMSRVIEAILLRIPLPIFYFDVSNPSNWVAIDGFHRINAIKMFMENNLLLQNMEILTNLNGGNYLGLEDRYKRILHDTQIVTYQVEAQTPPHLRELIFRKIRDINAN